MATLDFREWDEKTWCTRCGAGIKIKYSDGFDIGFSHAVGGYRCKGRQHEDYHQSVLDYQQECDHTWLVTQDNDDCKYEHCPKCGCRKDEDELWPPKSIADALLEIYKEPPRETVRFEVTEGWFNDFLNGRVFIQGCDVTGLEMKDGQLIVEVTENHMEGETHEEA